MSERKIEKVTVSSCICIRMSSKPKSADQSGDLRNRATTVQQDKTVAEISMKDFLDFLKISYQVNEAIDKSSPDFIEKNTVNWEKLTANELINRLKDGEIASYNEDTSKLKNELEATLQYKKPDSEKNSHFRNEIFEITDKEPAFEGSVEKILDHRASSDAGTESFTSLVQQSSAMSLDRKVIFDKRKISSAGRKKMSNIKRDCSAESETSTSFDSAEDRAPAKLLKKKLNEVLHEGIFDSILPYLLPKQHLLQENSYSAAKKLSNSNDVKKTINSNTERITCTSKEKMELRKKCSGNDIEIPSCKKDEEVVIHVCDEIKNLKRDFKCSQKLLVSQMGYFAEVTNGQKLEDMDISVHCDVTIFDWLMKWVQKDNSNQKHWPILDSSIVIPVLMSSAFLQMDSLQDHCLQYCQAHINDIIRDSPNLSCISDNVLTRLANLFSNAEMESIIDKKDKIQSKLYCKFIMALSEPEPQPQKGHFSSIATMYRCSKCLKLILKNKSGLILCVPSNITLDQNGCTHSIHHYDSSWNLTNYVRNLKADLKTWRKVYWRLWSDCHLLHCHACEEYFPIYQMSWCKYHPEAVQYFHFENQKSISHPSGRYPCCGERAYRFEVIKKISGCQYRDHILNSKSASDVEILRIWGLFKSLISCEPPPIISNGKFGKSSHGDEKNSSKDGFWWDGLKLVPSKQPPGLLSKMWETVTRKEDSKLVGPVSEMRNQKSPGTKTNPSTSNTQEISSLSDSSDESCSSSNGGNSEESCHSMTKITSKSKNLTSSTQYIASTRLSLIRKEKERKKKKKKNLRDKNDETRFWLSKLSTRSNQDNQRDFEERALRQVELILAKKLSGENFRSAGSKTSYQVLPPGGLYVKLEQEWREAHCFSHGCPGSSIKARGSASYVNMNNNSFTIKKRSKSKGHR